MHNHINYNHTYITLNKPSHPSHTHTSHITRFSDHTSIYILSTTSLLPFLSLSVSLSVPVSLSLSLTQKQTNTGKKFMSVLIVLFLFLVFPVTYVNSSEKLDLPDPAIKCGSCPCVNPCSQQLPPPPPSSNPSVQYCPPPPQTPPPPRFIYVTADTPPPPRFIYVTGPPGNLYPTDDPFNLQVYSTGGRRVVLGFLPIVCCGILGLLLLF